MKKVNLVDAERQPCDSDQEEQVWQAFKLGNDSAFTNFVTLFYPVLLKYGLRICTNSETVKDCLHNLFIDIWNRRNRMEEVRSIKAYLFTSLRRQLYKEIQRSQLVFSVDKVLDEYDFEVQFAVETDIIESEIKDENLLKLRANLEHLSKRQREAIYLRFYQSLEYDDIAQIMAINHHSAVNLIYEALKMLRKHWRGVVFMLLFTSL
ncbi:RNA polymerase sigma factor [Fibrella aquatica]|jgi:RNA polymerase sigma factor (sigma-70 family)|uniref:RNA polymerase sigma factor n=1 Tax=Fibrella aquatica TaxID=3242487 RepID=UPI003520819C